MVAVAKGGMLEQVGLVGSCREVAAPRGGEGVWQQCRAGKLEGRPDLRRDSCQSAGVYHGLEYWHCPAPLAVDRSAAAGSRTRVHLPMSYAPPWN